MPRLPHPRKGAAPPRVPLPARCPQTISALNLNRIRRIQCTLSPETAATAHRIPNP